MKDRRPVDALSVEELEEILRVRRSEERLRRLRSKANAGSLDPLRGAPAQPAALSASSPLSRAAAAGVAGTRYSAVVNSPVSRRAGTPIQWRWVWDRFLVLVELLALCCFILVVLQLFSTINVLNEDSRTLHLGPSLTATPMIDVVILPGGHTPPDARGYSEPALIPEHLQGLVAQITPLPVPTPGPQHARRIVIPDLGVDAPVVEGDDAESLKKGAAHHIGSANPGARGNCIISAHNDIYGEIFRDLPDMKVGDEIFVETETQNHRYVVQQTRIINEDDVSVMLPTSSPVLTLISCYPYRIDTHRIVVIAALENN